MPEVKVEEYIERFELENLRAATGCQVDAVFVNDGSLITIEGESASTEADAKRVLIDCGYTIIEKGNA